MKHIWIGALFLSMHFSTVYAAKADNTHDVKVEITIQCPNSEELEAYIASIPGPDCPSETKEYTEWADSFVHTMNTLIQLVESGKVNNCSFKANCEPVSDDSTTQFDPGDAF